jgi:hypothetical protein
LQRWTLIFGLFGALTFGGYQALINPKTPLSSAWNPTQPLDVNDPVTPLTFWKLGRAAEDAELCITALQNAAAQFELEEDFSESDICHIRPRVRLHGVGQANLVPVETRCATALRLAMLSTFQVTVAGMCACPRVKVGSLQPTRRQMQSTSQVSRLRTAAPFAS